MVEIFKIESVNGWTDARTDGRTPAISSTCEAQLKGNKMGTFCMVLAPVPDRRTHKRIESLRET